MNVICGSQIKENNPVKTDDTRMCDQARKQQQQQQQNNHFDFFKYFWAVVQNYIFWNLTKLKKKETKIFFLFLFLFFFLTSDCVAWAKL